MCGLSGVQVVVVRGHWKGCDALNVGGGSGGGSSRCIFDVGAIFGV